MNKLDQFISWLCGEKGVRFPFFRKEDMPKIPMPIGFQKDKEIENDRIENLKERLNYQIEEGLISIEQADELLKNPDKAEEYLDYSETYEEKLD